VLLLLIAALHIHDKTCVQLGPGTNILPSVPLLLAVTRHTFAKESAPPSAPACACYIPAPQLVKT
jgi:hypothetical protein